MSVDPLDHYPPEYVSGLQAERDRYREAVLKARDALQAGAEPPAVWEALYVDTREQQPDSGAVRQTHEPQDGAA